MSNFSSKSASTYTVERDNEWFNEKYPPSLPNNPQSKPIKNFRE